MPTNIEQPMELVGAPKAYPGHDYAGQGELVRIRVGQRTVGWLSRPDTERVGWLPAPSDDELVGIVRQQVQGLLREGAAAGRPLLDTWAEILDTTQHDQPVRGSLSRIN
jgi:hypothetical protein